MTDSTEYDWDIEKPERHIFLALVFDVLAAKRILKETPHPVKYASRKQLEPFTEPADYDWMDE
jgi:hypothetical protein